VDGWRLGIIVVAGPTQAPLLEATPETEVVPVPTDFG
jgi:hypothetical protein